MQENGFPLFLTVKRTSIKFWKMFFLVSSSLPRPWRKTDNHLAWWTWSKAKLQLIISFRKRRNKSKLADRQLLMNMRSKVSNSGNLNQYLAFNDLLFSWFFQSSLKLQPDSCNTSAAIERMGKWTDKMGISGSFTWLLKRKLSTLPYTLIFTLLKTPSHPLPSSQSQ